MRTRSIASTGLGFQLFRHAVLGLGAFLMLAPFVIMISVSLKPSGEIFSPEFTLLPKQWHAWQNYSDAFTKQPLARYILNGFIVTGAIFTCQLLTALPCAYALAKLRWRGRETMFTLVLLGLLIPPQVTAIPLYILLWQLGLLNTYAAIILPSTISVFGIFLMRQFFLSIPAELEEAAALDGCNRWQTFLRVILPLARPAMATLAIFTLLGAWNDLVWPLIAINNEDLFTVQLGIANFQGTRRTQWSLLMAGNVIATAPLIAFFLFAQKHFIATMTMSGLKG